MALQAQYRQDGCNLDFTPVAACLDGDVVKMPQGMAGVCIGNIAAAQLGAARVEGVVKMLKTASVALLQGGDVYWDVSAGTATYKADSGTPDFYVGTVDTDALGADTYVYVRLNAITRHDIDIDRATEQDGWTVAKTGSPTGFVLNAGASGIPIPGVKGMTIAATNEAEMLSAKSNRTFLGATKGIAEFRLTEVSASTSDVDIDFGIASGGHASDFETVDAFAAFHRDGGDLVIDYHSDDTSTDRAITTTGVSLVQSTFNEFWIDFRDAANVKFYIDAVLIDTSAAKGILTAAAATAMGLVIMVEKASGTATAEIRFSKARARFQAE